ncbi:IS1380 family transposase [Thiolapillus sp.]|uniref:IS1380 family transposase n=17 Tax=Thiolapillus sp. TaxID=2017437 RepID=UPI0025EC3D4B|nr:IS1380 family transposase [Thiolapillus sp.]
MLISLLRGRALLCQLFFEIFSGFSPRSPQPREHRHSVRDLVAQRVYGLALGYEDLNDHDDLRKDSTLALLVGKRDLTGERRVREQDRGNPLAASSTLNRLELGIPKSAISDRYKRIAADNEAMDRLLVDLFLESYRKPPRKIWLDLDATDDPLHGQQEGRFFHGYYRCYCYLPLYIFSGEHLLCARLRTADKDASSGSVDELQRIVGQIRARWPKTRIIIRADSGFCRDAIMAWCETNDVGYVLGLARNKRLQRALGKEMEAARLACERTGETARCFRDFRYRTRKSWSCERRVIGKAEYLPGKANPRFVVTNLSTRDADAQHLYEDLYYARGEMENRIKEQQLGLFADRTSSATLRANQLRLYFSSFAYVLLHGLRRLGLTGTAFAKAQSTTIRLKLLKIGARLRLTARKVWLSFSEAYSYASDIAQILANLKQHPAWSPPG